MNPAPPEPASALARLLRDEIARTGALPFARFMELALYQPVHGYYERTAQAIGKRGDFFTSVSVGPLFGELLASRFAEWLEELAEVELGSARGPRAGLGGPPKPSCPSSNLGVPANELVERSFRRAAENHTPAACAPQAALPPPPQPLQLIEAGAHNGQLARDILTWFQRERPGQFAQLEYLILEPSPRRQAWQAETLQPFAKKIRWLRGWHELPVASVHGIIFSNELLDAFPVRRLGWDAPNATWFEWAVACEADTFSWTRLPLTDDPRELFHPFPPPPELTAVLPDGFTTEVCPTAVAWWRDAAHVLQRGKLLTIDYGLNAVDFFTPARASGTLRTYAHHRSTADLLATPGAQDLTAHLNFTALQTAGETAGLRTDARTTQARFLTALATRHWTATAPPTDPSVLRQFQTLTHPDHLGRSFSVLIQSRP